MTINEKQLKIEHRRFVEDVTGRIRDFKNGKYNTFNADMQNKESAYLLKAMLRKIYQR